MTDISLSPEAVEVQAPPDLEFPELAPDAAEVDQYAGLTPLEAVAAKTHPHISMCRLGWTRMDCVTCADELHQIRKYIPALALVIEADARADERRKVTDEMAEQIADEIQALLADSGALFEWLANHGLADASPGATLAAYLRDLKGTCSVCFVPPVAAASEREGKQQ